MRSDDPRARFTVGLKGRLARRGHVLNGYCAMPGAFSAEIYARQGWDCVTIDLQHGLIDYETAVAILQALSAIDVVPLVRVPALDAAIIGKVLDAGALGVTCPMIDTAADAALLVRCAKYPPLGRRSAGPVRAAQLYGMPAPAYVAAANQSIAVFAMIETREGVENIRAIAAVPGLDGVYIGATDLALSMGRSAAAANGDPEVLAAIERVLVECRQRGLIVGIVAGSPEDAWRLRQRGFTFITLLSDANALAQQAKRWVDSFRALAGDRSGAA